MADRLEPILLDEAPRAVLVFGDTNSTLAGALTAAKMDTAVAHVEAGLRSFDRAMPEEVNRVVVDHLCGLLLAPNDEAAGNLRAEGIGRAPLGRAGGPNARQRVVVVGDVMQDLCAATAPGVADPASIAADAPEPVRRLGLRPGDYVFATVHRAENRHRESLPRWTSLLGALERTVVLALHPGTKHVLDEFGATIPPNVHLVPPVGYRTTLALQLHAAAVATDSGGVQREAAWLGVPTLVLRETTEWPETLTERGGRAVLVGRDATRARDALERLAPTASARHDAEQRAAWVAVARAGAADAIAAAIDEWVGSGTAP
jgi:UDP-N-acetylglucosamine 2-epimerase